MHIISKKRLKEFWEKHPTSEPSLRHWYKIVNASEFSSFASLREIFGSVDEVNGFFVFNIGGNKTRLITAINFKYQTVYVRFVFTHAEYSKGAWKL